VKVVWKNRPLEFHKDAMPAALAGMAANEQGRFWEFHDKTFASQPNIGRDRLMQIAGEIGLDMKRFEAAFNTAKYKSDIDADIAEANGLGASGTPAFFINGRFMSGAKPLNEFATIINAELTRLNVPIPPAAAAAAQAPTAPPAGAVQVRPVPPAATAPVR